MSNVTPLSADVTGCAGNVTASVGDRPQTTALLDDASVSAGSVGEMAAFVSSHCPVCQDCERWQLDPQRAWMRVQAYQRNLDRLRDIGCDTSSLPRDITDTPQAETKDSSYVTLKQPPADPSYDVSQQSSLDAICKSLLSTIWLGSDPNAKISKRSPEEKEAANVAQPWSTSSKGGDGGSSGFCKGTASLAASPCPQSSRREPETSSESKSAEAERGPGPSRQQTPTVPGPEGVPERGGFPGPILVPESPVLFSCPDLLGERYRMFLADRFGTGTTRPSHDALGGQPSVEMTMFATSAAARPPSEQPVEKEEKSLRRRSPEENEEPGSFVPTPPSPKAPETLGRRTAVEHDERVRGSDVTCSVQDCCCSIRNTPCPRHDAT